MIPRLISGWPKVAEKPARRTSQAIASSQPPPNASPLTAAMVMVRERSHERSRSCAPSSSSRPELSSILVKALMSAPAQNRAGLGEARIIALTSGSASIASHAVRSSPMTSGEIELAGGLSSDARTSSSPRKSARAKGPGIMPVPIIIPRSMSRTPAMPSSSTRQDSTNAFSCKRSASASSMAGAAAVSGVLIEALSGLLAEIALLDELGHAVVDVEAVAVGVLHVARDLERRVEARHVGEEERAHGDELGVRERLVDLLHVGAALVLVAPDLRRRRGEDAVDDEAGALRAADGHLADRLREVGRRLHRLRRGLLALDDLDQAHVGGRPEEVEAHDLVRPVGDVADLRDRQPRRVGGEHRVAGGGRVEVGEDLVLDLHLLRDGLDDEVDVAEAVVLRRAGDQPERVLELGVGLFLGQLLLLDQLGGLALGDLACLLEALVHEFLFDVLEEDGDVGGGDDLGDLPAHDPGPHDSGFEDEHGGILSRGCGHTPAHGAARSMASERGLDARAARRRSAAGGDPQARDQGARA